MARRVRVDTVSTLRRHWAASFIFAILTTATAVLVELGRGDDVWRVAATGAITAVGSIVLGSLLVALFHAWQAPKKLRAEDATAEMAKELQKGGRDAMFSYLRSALSDPGIAIVDACIFGSAVVAYPPPRDVDVAVRFAKVPDGRVLKSSQVLEAVAKAFEREFERAMHVQRFLYHERPNITRFNLRASPRHNLFRPALEGRIVGTQLHRLNLAFFSSRMDEHTEVSNWRRIAPYNDYMFLIERCDHKDLAVLLTDAYYFSEAEALLMPDRVDYVVMGAPHASYDDEIRRIFAAKKIGLGHIGKFMGALTRPGLGAPHTRGERTGRRRGHLLAPVIIVHGG